MNNSEDKSDIDIYEFYYFLFKFKNVILLGVLIPALASILFYFYQPTKNTYTVNVELNFYFNFLTPENLAIQNISILYSNLKFRSNTNTMQSFRLFKESGGTEMLYGPTDEELIIDIFPVAVQNPLSIIRPGNYLSSINMLLGFDNFLNQIKNNIKLDEDELIDFKRVSSDSIQITYNVIFKNEKNIKSNINKINQYLHKNNVRYLKNAFDISNNNIKKMYENSFANVENEQYEKFMKQNKIILDNVIIEINKLKIFDENENFYLDMDNVSITKLSKSFFQPQHIIILPILSLICLFIIYYFKTTLREYRRRLSDKN